VEEDEQHAVARRGKRRVLVTHLLGYEKINICFTVINPPIKQDKEFEMVGVRLHD